MPGAAVTTEAESAVRDDSVPVGVHLVGSVPLGSAEEVFRRTADALGDRLRRMPDGETGPRSDWILWQYPVFSSRPEFEIGPPGIGSYRTLPQLRLRSGVSAAEVEFNDLGYAEAAIFSYGLFSELKRDGVIPSHCRFQLSLPTPLAPVTAFVAPDHQAEIEPLYEARVTEEIRTILARVPADQLAIQWDTRFEFGMLEGTVPAWFSDVRAGILERLLRLSRHVPRDVELGFHLCYGDDAHGHVAEPSDSGMLVGIANSIATSLDRPLNWIHMPVPADRTDDEYFAPLADLALAPETELYLGVLHLGDDIEQARERIDAASRHVTGFGIASHCGWGRGGSNAVAATIELHRAISAPLADDGGAARFQWPEGFERVPDDEWTRLPVEETGLAYDNVEGHGWYSNLDRTVEQLAEHLDDGDVLIDYSGGTGILIDRLRLRVFDRQVGAVIVDASPKFLRVALEKYRDDPLLALRLLRFVKDEKRLQALDEVLGEDLLERGVDAVVAVNAIHLYPDFGEVARVWHSALRPDGKLFINSGNLRNPTAGESEWIIDETVWVINDVAEGLVRTDERYAKYRDALEDEARMQAHSDFRSRVFLKPRSLDFYTEALAGAGLAVEDVGQRTIEASVQEWYEFLTAYHEAVLGWVGGTKRIEGEPATKAAVEDRLALIRQAMDTLFGGRSHFDACWTYITCSKGIGS